MDRSTYNYSAICPVYSTADRHRQATHGESRKEVARTVHQKEGHRILQDLARMAAHSLYVLSCRSCHLLRILIGIGSIYFRKCHRTSHWWSSYLRSSITRVDQRRLWFSGTLFNLKSGLFLLMYVTPRRLQSFNTPEHTKYTVAQINTYPIGIQAVQVVTSTYKYRYVTHNSRISRSFDVGVVFWCDPNAMASYAASGGEYNVCLFI